MALHAGFAVVATASEKVVNKVLNDILAATVNPLSAALPPGVQVGGQNVVLNGTLVLLLPISVTLKSRADNLVTVSLAFAGVVDVGIGNISTYEIVLQVACDIGVIAVTTPKSQYAAAIDLSVASLTSVALYSISGGIPVGAVQAALQSPAVLAQLSAVLRTVGQVQITPGLINATYHLSQTYQPYKGSLFNPRSLFDITLNIPGVVVKPLDGALALAIDLAGITSGDASALVDINTAWVESSLIRVIQEDTYTPLDYSRGGRRNSSFAVIANADAISAVMGIMSGQISGKFPSDDHVQLNGVSISLGLMRPPMYAYSVPGATLRADLTYWGSTKRDSDSYIVPESLPLSATATLYADIELLTHDGDMAWLSRQPPDFYRTNVLAVDIDPSSALTAAVIAGGALVSILTFGYGTAFAVVGVLAVLDGVIPGIIGNVENQVAHQLQAGLNANASSIGIGKPEFSVPIPGGLQLDLKMETLISSDGVVTFFGTSEYTNSPMIRVPDVVSVYDPNPIIAQLIGLPEVFNAQDPTWRVAWTVVRTDTSATILSTDQRASTPGALTISIDHASPALMPVDLFQVNCTLYRNLGYTVQTFPCAAAVEIDDYLDRHHAYIRWDNQVWWPAPNSPKGTYWSRIRHSRIHRTSVPGRCEVMRHEKLRGFLKMKAKGVSFKYMLGQYLDELPFPLSEINDRRHGALCDYCFFGGPTRTIPLIPIPDHGGLGREPVNIPGSR